MRAVVQRVKEASVKVDGNFVSQIGPGLLVFLGIGHDDRSDDGRYLAEKIANLRIFADGDGKMNLSLKDTSRAILAVSQFTLYADCRRGRRPSFSEAATPQLAQELYLEFLSHLRAQGLEVGEGVFQAHMEIGLVNDGPVTVLLSSEGEF
ncbi:MAG: D-tyrosyl-tRNA(Tyr) deacylase [Firmicutes bacterium]|nr:D-tyrosyl-tRNA(Tyr) deacylase [Bacillota bacterium]